MPFAPRDGHQGLTVAGGRQATVVDREGVTEDGILLRWERKAFVVIQNGERGAARLKL